MYISKIWRAEHGLILLIFVRHLTCYHVSVWYIIMPIFQELEHTGYLVLDVGFRAHVSSYIDFDSLHINYR